MYRVIDTETHEVVAECACFDDAKDLKSHFELCDNRETDWGIDQRAKYDKFVIIDTCDPYEK